MTTTANQPTIHDVSTQRRASLGSIALSNTLFLHPIISSLLYKRLDPPFFVPPFYHLFFMTVFSIVEMCLPSHCLVYSEWENWSAGDQAGRQVVRRAGQYNTQAEGEKGEGYSGTPLRDRPRSADTVQFSCSTVCIRPRLAPTNIAIIPRSHTGSRLGITVNPHWSWWYVWAVFNFPNTQE